METKQYNGFIGYGSSKKEALDSCIIISVLQNAYNIKGFEGLEFRRGELSPWAPKFNTLHIRELGYVKCVEECGKKYILCKGVKTPVTKSLFETLYKAFYEHMSMVDIAVCADEVCEFLKQNGISFKPMCSYNQVMPDDVYFDDKNITCSIITDVYSVILYNNGKASIKRNAEEVYWTCSSEDPTNALDLLYYIAYVRGYEGVDSLFKEG